MFARLHLPQGGVDAVAGHQLLVPPLFAEPAAVQHKDAVGAAYRGQPVGYDDGGAVDHDALQGTLDGRFCLVVYGGGCLIQDEHWRVFEYGAGNGDALALAAGEFLAAFADDGLVAVGQFHDEVVCFGDFGRGYNCFHAGIEGAVGDVFAHGAMKEEDVLADKTDGLA